MAKASNGRDGELPNGVRYRVEMPDKWNGDLLLQAAPIPVPLGDPPWTNGEDMFRASLERGYAIAGSANNIFWPLEGALADQELLLDEFEKTISSPGRVIAIGSSIGGIMTAGVVQRMPDRISGAVPMCGNLAGAVGIHNRELDMAFAVKHLIGRNTELQVVSIGDPERNFRLATDLLSRAQENAAGRARLALVAAIGNVPGWFSAGEVAPAPADFAAQEQQQFGWYDEVVFLVLFSLREQVERQAGGNGSWNIGIDYHRRWNQSINRDQVAGLYDLGGIDLEADLEILSNAERISADPAAVAYLERNIVFNGDLGGVPVVVMHSIGDGLVTPDNPGAFMDVVQWAGNDGLLRVLWVKRGGHCAFTDTERLTALDVLTRRIETGEWGPIEPEVLNEHGGQFDERHQRVVGMGAGMNTPAMRSAFVSYEPPEFPRLHDVRHIQG